MAKQALDGTRLNAFGMEPESLIIVGHDTSDGPEHPLWDVRATKLHELHELVGEEFIASVMSIGVKTAVMVRKNGERNEIVFGRSRVYAARIANKRLTAAGKGTILVPTMVLKVGDAMAEDAMTAENEIRTNNTPMVRAEKIQRYLSRGRSEHEAAVAFGCSADDIRRYVAVFDLDDRVRDLIAEGKLTVTAALTLVDLTREEQFQKAQEYAASGVTVEEAKRQTKIRKAGNGHAEEVRSTRPSVKFIRSLTEDEDFLSGLSSDARDLLFFFLGEQGRAQRIKGLTAKLKEAGA